MKVIFYDLAVQTGSITDLYALTEDLSEKQVSITVPSVGVEEVVVRSVAVCSATSDDGLELGESGHTYPLIAESGQTPDDAIGLLVT